MLKDIFKHKRTLKLVGSEIVLFRYSLGLLIISIAVVTIINIQIPFFIGSSMGVVFEKKKIATSMIVLVGFIYFLKIAGQFLMSYLTKYITRLISLDMMKEIIWRIINSHVPNLENIQSGDIIQKVFTEMGTVQGKLIFGTMFFLKDCIFVVVLMTSLWYMSPAVFAIMIVLGVVLYVYNKLFGRAVEKNNFVIQKENSKLLSYFVEVLNGKKEIFIYAIFQKVKGKVDEFTGVLKKHFIIGSRLGAMNDLLMELIFMFATMAVVGILLLQGKGYKELITIFAIFSMINGPLRDISDFLISISSIKPSMTRVEELLVLLPDNEQPVTDGSEHHHLIKNNQVSLNVDNISYGYLDNKKILNGFSYEFSNGFHLVIGPNGAGKSTLLEILMGLRNPDTGSISLNVNELDNGNFSNHVRLVRQESFLFNDSLLNNLKFIDDKVNEESCTKIMQDCSIFDIFDKLDQKLDTVVGEASKAISGGERQLINILRGFLIDPPVLLLDEITNNLPHHITDQLIRYIKEHRQNKITIFVSHQALDHKQFDSILKLKI